MHRVAYHRLAANELLTAARWYDRQILGLGDEFLDAVDETILKLKRSPDVGRLEADGVRSWKTKRFPFRLFYEVQPDRIWIVAVGHLSRRPGYWHRRL